MEQHEKIRSTTVIAVKRNGKVAMAGDGQVTMGNTIMKGNARKVRRIFDGKVLTGFAGATADAFTLFDKFELKLKEFNGDLTRSAVELAKLWRTDRAMSKLDALLLVADKDKILLISGSGDVIEPENDILAIGSGGNYAYAAALAYIWIQKSSLVKELNVEKENLTEELVELVFGFLQLSADLEKHTLIEDRLLLPDEDCQLSAREQEILAFVAKGMSSKAIADALNLSVHTVNSHRKNISRKTGIRSVAGLAVYATIYANGLDTSQ